VNHDSNPPATLGYAVAARFALWRGKILWQVIYPREQPTPAALTPAKKPRSRHDGRPSRRPASRRSEEPAGAGALFGKPL